MSALDQLAAWPVANCAAALVVGDRVVDTWGHTDQLFPLASVTKLLTSMAALVAHEEGTLDLDAETWEQATVADLLAHSAGVAADEPTRISGLHRRRTYSTAAYDLVADAISARARMPFDDYLFEAVFTPLGVTRRPLVGSAGAGGVASVDDLTAIMRAWRSPILIDKTTLDRARRPHLAELAGVLPGFGRQEPNLWGLGPEIRGNKTPHWTGLRNSPTTFGHFGQAGTMAWVDPVADATLIALSDEPFGAWAAAAWPALADAVLAP
jgi:CubicO group peptidase (beta-lactamase class C family)